MSKISKTRSNSLLKTDFSKNVAGLMLLTVLNLVCFINPIKAQQRKVPQEPIQFVNAITGEQIPEVLITPLYSSYTGVFVAPEGPSSGYRRNYLDNPFIYRGGDRFAVKKPRWFTGLPLLFIFIGKGKEIDGITVIARGYRPLWFDDLWSDMGAERKRELTPISDDEWSQLLKKEFDPFLHGAERINEHCIWGILDKCDLEVKYDKKERELVRSFLQRKKTETK